MSTASGFRLRGLLFSSVALALSACGSETPADESAAASSDDMTTSASSDSGTAAADDPAVLAFRDAFESEDFDRVDEVLAGLDRAAKKTPKDASLALTNALAHLWKLGEMGRLGDVELVEQGKIAFKTRDLLELAQKLAPGDARIPGWLGPVTIRIGTALHDEETEAKGWAILDEGVRKYPEFNLFSKAMVLSDLDRSDPKYAGAMDAIWDNIEGCPGAVTPEAPEVPKDIPQAKGEIDGKGRVCGNDDLALHNFEGFWVYAADIFAKGGDEKTAKAFYENARALDSFASWNYGGMLKKRLSTLGERIAAFGDDDPKNDPEMVPLSPYSCAVCHAK